MKVFLISPATDEIATIPLGLAYVSAVLKRSGHAVRAIDASAPLAGKTQDEIIEEVKKFSPDLIGITMNIFHTKSAYRLAKELKKLKIPIVSGGPFPSIRPDEVLDNGFDMVVRGEGEYTALELLEYLSGKRKIEEVLGLSYKKDGKNFHNSPRPLIDNLDELPFPDRDIFPMSNYVEKEHLSGGVFWTGILTSRGCPGVCTYCVINSVHGRGFRYRTAENIYKELKELNDKYKSRIIRFVDDAFTHDTKRLHKICDMIIEDKLLNIIWDCDSRINDVTEDTLSKMKESGCKSIIFGVESGDPETLKRVKKGTNLTMIHRTLDIVSKVGIDAIKINIIIGFPWENKSHIDNSMKLLKEYSNKLLVIYATHPIIPYPGTPLYEEYHKDYSFTDWWQKEGVFKETDLGGHIPFYKKYFLYVDNFALRQNFFKYSRPFKKYMEKAMIKTGKMIKRKNFGVVYTELLYVLAYVSYFLSKIDYDLEYKIFNFLRNTKIKRFITSRKKAVVKK